MKVLGLLAFVICDVIFSLTLKRRVFRNLVNVWLSIGALLYAAVMGGFYLETMRGEGRFGFSQEALHFVEFWCVIVLCGTMVLFHIWVLTLKVDD
ncbi:hypothetical protein [Pseudomonas sp. KCJK8927]|uniref:hypothetical protein n=1 Tax=Pseudomonas sp. KCJK8927 TaxID=3344560 RepID=UPI0039058B51